MARQCDKQVLSAGVTYLDENVPTSASSFYTAIFLTCATLGPAFGYVFGGYFISLYTDFPTNPKFVYVHVHAVIEENCLNIFLNT